MARVGLARVCAWRAGLSKESTLLALFLQQPAPGGSEAGRSLPWRVESPHTKREPTPTPTLPQSRASSARAPQARCRAPTAPLPFRRMRSIARSACAQGTRLAANAPARRLSRMAAAAVAAPAESTTQVQLAQQLPGTRSL
jgi:hypothetical protein